jgi:hypothetical protein
MHKLSLAVASVSAGLLLSLWLPGAAHAHFMLVSPPSWWSQLSDGSPQKTAPCGDEATAGTAATGMVTVYQPGQSVSVTVTATIAHPGWWRISLREGAASTQTGSNFPDPATLGAAGTALECTPAFIDNPVWSPTQPVLADKLGLPAGSTSTTTFQSGTQTFQVTIPPGAQCSSASPCTLQVVMFMTDHSAGNCNYHHCADLAAGTSAGGQGGAGAGGTATGSGGSTGAGQGGSSNGGAGSSANGCSVAVGGGTVASWIGVLFALVLVLRRRRGSK